jgi:hypothetical protein
MFASLRASGGATRRKMCEAIQRPGTPVHEGWIASSQGLLAMTETFIVLRMTGCMWSD